MTEEADDSGDMEGVGAAPVDFFDHEPTRDEKIEVRMECAPKESRQSHNRIPRWLHSFGPGLE